MRTTHSMTEKIEINGVTHIHTAVAAKRLGISSKRVLDYIAKETIDAVYLNGYYMPEAELRKLRQRRPGRPKGSTKAKGKKR